MSWLLVGCMFTFFEFLRNADVDYLNLSHPSGHGKVVCGLTEPFCKSNDNPLRCIFQFHEPLFGAVDVDAALAGGECSSTPQQQCSEVTLPVTAIQGDLSKLHTVNRRFNPLRAWAWLYIWLILLLWLYMVVHDLALLQGRCRPKILSMRAAKQEMPMLWACISRLQCLDPMSTLRRKSCLLWGALLPVWFAFQVAFFLTLVYPLSLVGGLFWWCPLGPVRVSRVMVFQTGILSFFWSLIFVFANLLSPVISHEDFYAIFWHQPSIDHGCVCYCEYPLRPGVSTNLIFFGIVVVLWSASISFRALKGLRRPNWGNLFSILYTVPIEAFPVEWERPAEAGGGPINLRKAGEPVQSEPAFDPFCLMDEQPESGRTRVHLFPVPQGGEQVRRWSRSRDPTADSEIACCGFPMTMTGGSSPRASTMSSPRPSIMEHRQSLELKSYSPERKLESIYAAQQPAPEPSPAVKGMLLPVFDACSDSLKSPGSVVDKDRIEVDIMSSASEGSFTPSDAYGVADDFVSSTRGLPDRDAASSSRGEQSKEEEQFDDDDQEEAVLPSSGDAMGSGHGTGAAGAREARHVDHVDLERSDFAQCTWNCNNWACVLLGPRLPRRSLLPVSREPEWNE